MPHPFKEIYNALFYIFFSQTHDWGQELIIIAVTIATCNNINWSTALERKISWSVGIVIIIVIVVAVVIVILWGE